MSKVSGNRPPMAYLPDNTSSLLGIVEKLFLDYPKYFFFFFYIKFKLKPTFKYIHTLKHLG